MKKFLLDFFGLFSAPKRYRTNVRITEKGWNALAHIQRGGTVKCEDVVSGQKYLMTREGLKVI